MPMPSQSRKLSKSEDVIINKGKSEIQPLINATNNKQRSYQNEDNDGKPKKSLPRRYVKAVANYVAHKEENEKDIVQRFAGILGRWQLWICFAIFLAKFPIAWHQLIHVVAAPVTNFWCKDDNSTSQCSAECKTHEFDRSVFTETIISQWDLVCDRRNLANLSQVNVMLGILVGNVLFGYIADRWGRRYPLVGAVILQSAAGTAAAIVPWFWAYLVFRFLSTVATGGTMVTSFVLIMELVGTKWRTAVGTLYQIPFNLGHCTLPVIAYFLRDWRYQQLVISLPSALLICYCWVVPESPRWLLAMGKAKEVTRVLERAAKVNKLPTDKIAAAVDDHIQAKANNAGQQTKRGGNPMNLIRTRSMRMKTIAICFNWLVCGLCFFGGAQFMGQLGGSIFINVFLSAIVQVPGTFLSIITMEKLGRRCTLIFGNTLAGVSMLLICVMPDEPNWIKAMLGTVAMFGLSISFPTVYIFSGELFPTTIRNVGVGASSMSARFGSMAAPFVATLNTTLIWLPSLIFGITPLIGTLLCYVYLPETLGVKLPDSLEEAAKLTVNCKPCAGKSATDSSTVVQVQEPGAPKGAASSAK